MLAKVLGREQWMRMHFDPLLKWAIASVINKSPKFHKLVEGLAHPNWYLLTNLWWYLDTQMALVWNSHVKRKTPHHISFVRFYISGVRWIVTCVTLQWAFIYLKTKKLNKTVFLIKLVIKIILTVWNPFSPLNSTPNGGCSISCGTKRPCTTSCQINMLE